MQAMQYKIGLPEDYDMTIIKNRVGQNGHKTDQFEDLLFKAYLVTEKASGSLANSYCPLYIWKQTEGMNKFIFGGFYDNIIQSFGWQQIEIGVTALVNLSDSFPKSRYMLEAYYDILPQVSLTRLDFNQRLGKNEVGKVIIYNPEKWKYVVLTFFEEPPATVESDKQLYTLLHLSLGK